MRTLPTAGLLPHRRRKQRELLEALTGPHPPTSPTRDEAAAAVAGLTMHAPSNGAVCLSWMRCHHAVATMRCCTDGVFLFWCDQVPARIMQLLWAQVEEVPRADSHFHASTSTAEGQRLGAEWSLSSAPSRRRYDCISNMLTALLCIAPICIAPICIAPVCIAPVCSYFWHCAIGQTYAFHHLMSESHSLHPFCTSPFFRQVARRAAPSPPAPAP